MTSSRGASGAAKPCSGEREQVGFGVVHDLEQAGVGQQGGEKLGEALGGELGGDLDLEGALVAQRDVGGAAGGGGECEADQAGAHRVGAVGDQVQGEEA